MKRLSHLFVISILGLFLLAAHSYAADCNLAQQHFSKGLAAGKNDQWQESQQWLSKSVAQCNRFDNWYLLGQAEQQLKNYAAALSAFEDARRYAKGNDEKATAIARYAEVQSQQGLIAEPLTLLHEARKIHTNPPPWITQLALKLDTKRIDEPLTIAQVTGALNNRSIKIFNLDTKPSINVSINFKYNSVDVIGKSRKSIDVLAEALADKSFDDRAITVVGHSDARGDEQYNQKLSERRAQSIAQLLVAKVPKLRGRLKVVGFGEKKPLYSGSSEHDYLLNRRIEVQLD